MRRTAPRKPRRNGVRYGPAPAGDDRAGAWPASVEDGRCRRRIAGRTERTRVGFAGPDGCEAGATTVPDRGATCSESSRKPRPTTKQSRGGRWAHRVSARASNRSPRPGSSGRSLPGDYTHDERRDQRRAAGPGTRAALPVGRWHTPPPGTRGERPMRSDDEEPSARPEAIEFTRHLISPIRSGSRRSSRPTKLTPKRDLDGLRIQAPMGHGNRAAGGTEDHGPLRPTGAASIRHGFGWYRRYGTLPRGLALTEFDGRALWTARPGQIASRRGNSHADDRFPPIRRVGTGLCLSQSYPENP